jgi:hypothetical protein
LSAGGEVVEEIGALTELYFATCGETLACKSPDPSQARDDASIKGRLKLCGNGIVNGKLNGKMAL